MLDLRFVFVLRCLYRQGEKTSKPQNSAKNTEFRQNKSSTKNSKPIFVNTSCTYKNYLSFYQSHPKGGTAQCQNLSKK